MGRQIPYVKGVGIDDSSKDNITVAVEAAKDADTIILGLGDSVSSCTEWGDRSDLDLPAMQLPLLYNITEAYPEKKVAPHMFTPPCATPEPRA